MPHRGWRIGRGSLETAQTDRLTADRLEGFLSFLGSVSPESPTDSEVVDAPEQEFEPQWSANGDSRGKKSERSGPDATSPLVDSPPTVPLPAVVAPTVVAQAEVAPTVVAQAVVAPTVVAQAVSSSPVPDAVGAEAVVALAVVPEIDGPATVREFVAQTERAPSEFATAAPAEALTRTGRHRSPTSSRLSIRGISLSARRLALLAAVTALVVVSAVLALT
jgi:hypothetical protein